MRAGVQVPGAGDTGEHLSATMRSEYDEIFAVLDDPAMIATTAALETLHKSPFQSLQSRESRAVLGGVMNRKMGPAAVRQAARWSLKAQVGNSAPLAARNSVPLGSHWVSWILSAGLCCIVGQGRTGAIGTGSMRPMDREMAKVCSPLHCFYRGCPRYGCVSI
eukprot:COSAG05_NODE_2457_length_3038_cov_4.874107_2_plen_163_part_00